MVLHLKGADEDSFSRVPIQDCITLLDGLSVSIQATIFLHCFLGDLAQVKLWIDTGRPIYFGVSGRVRSMLDTQHEEIRAIPKDRILMETESPYLSCGSDRPMTPKHIGKVYQLVAIIRGKPMDHLAEAVANNFHAFFAKQWARDTDLLSFNNYAVYPPGILFHYLKLVRAKGSLWMTDRGPLNETRYVRALDPRAPMILDSVAGD